ncbi:MAG: cyclodeaminase/cyclohydrolase family protein [Actinomycetota bacterium]
MHDGARGADGKETVVQAPDYLAEPLGRFLDELAARAPAPSGGAAAAIGVGLAAALTAMVGRASTERLTEAAKLVHRADELRLRAGSLAGEDAAAYRKVLDALAAPAGPDPEARRRRVDDALSGAADVPLAIAQVGAEVGDMAARLVDEGDPKLRGDALTAVWLAAAGAAAAAELVLINLRDRDPGDDRLRSARRARTQARRRAATVG